MTWFAFTIISPILNALVNYIDKYLIEKVVEGRGIGSLIIFSALMGLPVALLILLFGPNVFGISTKNALLIMLNGTFYVAWVLPYLYALQKDEASVVVPLILQLTSVLAFILGFIFLGETLSLRQVIGCLLILIGALGLTLEINSSIGGKSTYKIKSDVLLFSLLSCFFAAVSGVIFKFIALEESFWVTSFWENIGIFISALILLCIPVYKSQFQRVFKKDAVRVFSLNALNESLISVGRTSLNYATLLAPIALVFFVDSGFQPFFVLSFGILLSIFFPKFVEEDLRQVKLIQKFLSILIMFGGTYLISF